MRTPVTAVTSALAAALSFTLPAHAAKDADLAEIRAQVKQMKEAYEQRIAALVSLLAESELGFSTNVDDKIYANLILSLSPDNSVEVEEACGVLTALPGGLRPKFGRFLSSIGYLNDQHQHGWDFYDAPCRTSRFLVASSAVMACK